MTQRKETRTRAHSEVDYWDEFGQGFKGGECIVCICGEPYPFRDELLGFDRPHYCPADEEPEPELCPMGCGRTTEDPYGAPARVAGTKLNREESNHHFISPSSHRPSCF
jgi:hypothetical protein